MTSCDIFFENNPQCIFYTGNNIAGYIELKNERALSIKFITLKIEGFAKCRWNEVTHTGTTPTVIEHRGRKDFINVTNHLITNPRRKKIDLAVGCHKYSFKQYIPPKLPISFESKYGHIRYQIKVEVERENGSNLKFCFPFSVVKEIDLNKGLSENYVLNYKEISKSFTIGLSSKKLRIGSEATYTGYVPGQVVTVTSIIDNETNEAVNETVVQLLKFIKYKSNKSKDMKSATKVRRERVVSAKYFGVAPNSTYCFRAFLLVPTIPPTNIDSCEIIKVFYEVHVIAKINGMYKDLALELPVNIGTVPIARFNPRTSTVCNPNLPPLSYQEAVISPCDDPDDDSNEGLDDEVPFSPKYPRRVSDPDEKDIRMFGLRVGN